MVRHFAGLKARLTWNGIRHDVQRRFGFPLATLLLTAAAVWLASRHVGIVDDLPAAAAGEYLGWAALIVFATWVTLPVVIFPLDENLDPQQLATLPISGNQMILGLAAASLIAPSAVVPLILGAANGWALSEAWWMALPATAVYAGLLVVGSQLFSTTISAVLRTRRGRDVATFLVLGIAAGSFFAYRSISEAVQSLGLARAAATHSVMDWAALVPPVGAQRAMVEAAAGRPGAGLAYLVTATAGLALMAITWRRLLGWMLTTPAQGSRPAGRARRRGLATGPWGEVATLARKELRFYVRDPRQRLVWTGTVIFVGLAVAATVMGASGLFDVSDNDWAPLVAPVLVLFVGLPIALNLFGWERNAASYLFVLPVTPAKMLLGKNLAVAIGLTVETAILAVALAIFSGFWGWVWLVLPLLVSAIGAQLAVGNLVSVLAPLRLPREGTDVFAQSTEQGCLAIVSQAVSFFAIGALMVPPASAAVLTVSFGRFLEPWITTVLAVGWGVALYSVSLWVSSRLLRRRLPEVMAWVQVV